MTSNESIRGYAPRAARTAGASLMAAAVALLSLAQSGTSAVAAPAGLLVTAPASVATTSGPVQVKVFTRGYGCTKRYCDPPLPPKPNPTGIKRK